MNEITETRDLGRYADFSKVPVQEVNLDQLRLTIREDMPYSDHQPLKGMYHDELFTSIMGMCESAGYKPEIYDLFVAYNRDGNAPGITVAPQLEAQFGQGSWQSLLVRRAFCNIRLTDVGTDEFSTNLSIAYHQKGIQVGMGPNVHICHNQCMLSPQLYVATYADNKRDNNKHKLPELLEEVSGWIANARLHFDNDVQRIEKMKAIKIPAHQTLTLIGELTALRVAHDSKDKELRAAYPSVYPLNQSQICKVTEKLLQKHRANGEVTLWDWYNEATEMYKPISNDIPCILTQNRSMIEFLQNTFEF